MVGYLLPLVISTVLGLLAGMGVGGGSLLLLWLTQVVMLQQTQARILNLLFYLPAATASTLLRAKDKTIQPQIVSPGIITGCISATICTVLAKNLNTELLKKLLGVLLIITGFREIFYRPRKAK